MIILNATTKTLEVILSGAVATTQLPIVSEYVDIGTATFAVNALGSSDTATNGASAVTAVAAPASGSSRQVKALFIYNADTAAATVTVRLNNNSTLRSMVVRTLQPGETLQYVDGQGWEVIAAPFVGRQLAQARENSTNNVSIFSPTKPTRITNIIICNQTALATTFRLFLDSSGSTYDESKALFYDTPIAANETFMVGIEDGWTMLAGNLAYQSGTANAVTITVFGEVKL